LNREIVHIHTTCHIRMSIRVSGKFFVCVWRSLPPITRMISCLISSFLSFNQSPGGNLLNINGLTHVSGEPLNWRATKLNQIRKRVRVIEEVCGGFLCWLGLKLLSVVERGCARTGCCLTAVFVRHVRLHAQHYMYSVCVRVYMRACVVSEMVRGRCARGDARVVC